MEYTMITGASGGIGEALAYKVAERKHNLVLVARQETKLVRLSNILTDTYGCHVKYIVADLSKPTGANQLFEAINALELKVTVLINNAGIGSSGLFTDIEHNTEIDLIQLNVVSLVSLSHHFLTTMKGMKRGTLINVASMTAFMPVPYMATYAASKAFVRSFTEALHEEYKPFGIHVMLVCPGLTKTNFNTAAGLDSMKGPALSSDYATAATQSPDEVAEEILTALDAKKSKLITGGKNRLGARILALLPNSLIARFMAGFYRKKLQNIA